MKIENPNAFPRQASESNYGCTGMTLLDYFIAHAPKEPQWGFSVKMDKQRPIYEKGKDDSSIWVQIEEWDKLYIKREIKQWPVEWAHAMLEGRQKYL